ncbi:MAG: hypothetical protein Q7R39_18210 [Dehalococcoidia bacterium]|nr:hypothetical protein [Dehalococcoidia bacterium]
MNSALSALRQALKEDCQVQEAIALARAEPDNASSKRVLELARAAEKVLEIASHDEAGSESRGSEGSQTPHPPREEVEG